MLAQKTHHDIRETQPQRRRFARHLIIVLAGLLTLAACAGSGELRGPARTLSPASLTTKFHVTGTDKGGGSYDNLVRTAFGDIGEFWAQAYPVLTGGQALRPPAGGVWSVDATNQDTREACMADSPSAVVNNSFYCPADDSFAYDRSGLPRVLQTKFGAGLVPLIFAHEFGHLIQNRLHTQLPSIDRETQADCASGAFMAAEAGTSPLKLLHPHFDVSVQSLDKVAVAMMLMRDYSPQSPMDDGSHGDGFDRIGAFFEGYREGVEDCYSPAWDARKFTERSYDSVADQAQHGNQSISQVLDARTSKQGGGGLQPDLNSFWTTTLSHVGLHFDPVHIVPRGTPPCARGRGVKFAYCTSDNAVYYDPEFAGQVYNSVPQLTQSGGEITVELTAPGDFALGTLLAYGWAMSVRHQLHLPVHGGPALLSASCYVGAYAGHVNAQNHTAFALSPQDLDEGAATVMLTAATPSTFGARRTTGLQRIAAFNLGYVRGFTACPM